MDVLGILNENYPKCFDSLEFFRDGGSESYVAVAEGFKCFLRVVRPALMDTAETDAFYDLIAMQHFATQATIFEIYGVDCLSDAELDGQLDWLYRWREQCRKRKNNQVGGVSIARRKPHEKRHPQP